MCKKIIILIIGLLICTSFGWKKSENLKEFTTQKIVMDQYRTESESDLWGILSIPSLKIEQPIYPIGTEENQVDKNVMLLKQEENLIVLASHSGNGPHAYFKNLNQIPSHAKIVLEVNQRQEEYIYFAKEEVIKNGTVSITKYDFPMLILITCSKTKEEIQEVYYAKLSKIYQ